MKPPWPVMRVDDLKSRSKYGMAGGPFGSNLVSQDYVANGVPVIRGSNLPLGRPFSLDDLVFVTEAKADSLRPNCAYPGDIIFTQRGTLGQVGIIPKDSPFPRFVISQSQMKLTVDSERADARYIYQYFRMNSTVEAIKARAISSGVPHINLDILRKFEILSPPIQIQRKIAAILTAYDDLIETNKRRIALLEKMAEELYREWFVRMRFPGYQNTKFVKGVPEGWAQKRFGEFCMLKRGYDLPDALVDPGQYPVMASTSIKTFHKHFKAEPPVITTGRSGSLGQVLMTHSRAWPLNTTLYVRDFFGNSAYLTFYMLKNMGLEGFNSGAGVPTLNRNHLNGLAVFVPEPNLQKGFDGIVEPLHQQADKLRQANVNLTQTRDLLLPRLISGKLSVDDLDIQLPPSMREEAGSQPAGTTDGLM